MSVEHHVGWPVSYGSYVRGCRCDGCREKQRAYREANKAEIAEKKRAYREANKAEIAEKQRASRRADPERHREYVRRYRARKAAERAGDAPTDLTVRIEQRIARGVPVARIMDELGVTYATVKDVLDRWAS